MPKSTIDRVGVETVLRDLVSIPSVNPAFPGGTGEGAISEYLQDRFERAGIPYELQEAAPGRSNVIGRLAARSPGPAFLFEAHMDTVQATGMTIDPFAPRRSGDRLYGRGACDTKGSLAAMVVAMETLAARGEPPSIGVHLAAVVDEEYRYSGASALAASIRSGERSYVAAIVGEPTGLGRIIAHKGCVRFRIVARGVPGHSSAPSSGLNAINGMCALVEFLETGVASGFPSRAHPLVGAPTHCVSLIQGGEAPNTIPAECSITIDRRTVPGEEPMEAWREYKKCLENFQSYPEGIVVAVEEPFLIDYALEASSSSAFVRRLGESVARVTGGRRGGEEPHGASYGTDASKLSRAGLPSVVFGPGDIRNAHTRDEWVSLDEVEAAAAALVDFVSSFKEG